MMKQNSLGDFFEFVSPYLNTELLSTFYYNKLFDIHRSFISLDTILLETRLSNNPQVDLNICIWKHECNLFSKWISQKDIQSWKVVDAWIKNWLKPNGPFYNTIPNIWLVYDIVNKSKVTKPWIIIAFRDLSIGRNAEFELAKKAIRIISRKITTFHWNNLEKAYSLIPDKGFIPGVCVINKSNIENRAFDNVDEELLRIGVRSFYSIDEIEDYLVKFGWPGDLDFIRKWYTVPIKLASYSLLSLTFNKDILPDLGIECYLNFNNNIKQAKQILQYLVNHGMCTKLKMESLISWIGIETSNKLSANAINQVSSNKATIIRRWILEIKMVYAPGNPPSAKAYIIYDKK